VSLEANDPFLLLNHHGPQIYRPANSGLPFGPHPHRGFETVTFVLRGELAHIDSAGHQSVIHEGGVQWMTAGSGLVHSEEVTPAFRRDGGPLELIQLWVNLPAGLKMSMPGYRGLEREEIPAIAIGGGKATVNLIAGSLEGRVGPVESLTHVTMMTAALDAGAAIELPAPAGRNVLLYVIHGQIAVSGVPVEEFTMVELDRSGDRVRIVATSPAAILFGHALPIGEPIVARGPFVMNTQVEIERAFRDYQAGRFGGMA
jgi:redox-sensitive bicupin YhaK (pirin superfamily)